MPASLLTVTPLTASGIPHVFDNIPQPGVILWLDASKIAGVSSGASLSVWTDSSASGSHATQPSAVSQPVFLTNSQNGLSTVSFFGSAYLTSMTSTTQPYTIAVTYSAATNTDRTLIAGANAGTGQNALTQSGGKYKCYAGTTLPVALGSTITIGAFVSDIAIFSGSSSTLAVSGETVAGNTGTTNAQQLLVGLFTAPATQPCLGKFGEIIVYNRALTEVERVSLETYLRTKWGTL